MVLDEPTSVLTPGEAEEVLGLVRRHDDRGELTVLMISHKFHEVMVFADDFTVLRKGTSGRRRQGREPRSQRMAAMMIGDQKIATLDARTPVSADAKPVLTASNIKARDRTGLKSIHIADLVVRAGEIVGIAGISGNGQKEFLEVLAGQRPRETGEIVVKGAPYQATRDETRALHVRFIPEEPLRNACAPRMTVAENLAFRTFDLTGTAGRSRWISASAIRDNAERLIARFKVKTASLESPIAALSGGNVQRAVLARELTGEVDVLIVANPCFGLDFAAVAEIRSRIMQARNAGAAVLLVSEDLDELLELSDRILVMSDGAIVYETPIASVDTARDRPAHGGASLMARHRCQAVPVSLSSPTASALIVIDMQRDFAEPGGFGDSLGNDVRRVQAIVPTVKRLIDGFRARKPAGDPHHGVPSTGPFRLPAGEARPRRAEAADRRRRADGTCADRRRAGHGDRERARARRRRDRHREARQGRLLRHVPAAISEASWRAAAGLRGRHHRGLRPDHHARGQ